MDRRFHTDFLSGSDDRMTRSYLRTLLDSSPGERLRVATVADHRLVVQLSKAAPASIPKREASWLVSINSYGSPRVIA